MMTLKKDFPQMTSVYKILAYMSKVHLKNHLMSAFSVLGAIYLHKFLKY